MQPEIAIVEEIAASLERSLQTKKDFWSKHQKEFFEVAALLYEAIQTERKVLIFGNGGSACDAMHFAGEWVNRYRQDRQPLPCMALTSDAPLLTCIGNDASFDQVFEKQILGLGFKNDIAIGISTSGNSKNVILALQAARKKGLKTVALLGGTGGKILSEKLADYVLSADTSTETARIQETHEWILHSLCEYIDFKILGPRKK